MIDNSGAGYGNHAGDETFDGQDEQNRGDKPGAQEIDREQQRDQSLGDAHDKGDDGEAD